VKPVRHDDSRPVLTRSPATVAVPDAATYELLLAVHREIELVPLVETLLRASAERAGAGLGVGWVLEEGRRVLTPALATDAADRRFAAFGSLRADEVAPWLAGGPRTFPGLGPFRASVGSWPGTLPAHVLAAAVEGEDDRGAGLLLLLLDGLPDEHALDRVSRLLDGSRPAVDNALRVASLRELVIKDDTANCFNRRYFEEFLPEELSRAVRFRSPLSLIFLDMDNLKQVNSRHGHAVGSRMLCEVSTRVRTRIRKFDRLFRFGGDEFCILLPETEWHGALEVAERVREAIGGQPFLAGELDEGRGIPMSASLGIASYPLHARTQAELVERADRAMQKVKKATKNAIGVAEIEGGA